MDDVTALKAATATEKNAKALAARAVDDDEDIQEARALLAEIEQLESSAAEK